MNELYQEWYNYKTQRVKTSTLSVYANLYKRHIRDYWGDKDVSTGINNKQMTRYIEYMFSEQHVSPQLARDAKVVLQNIMKYANLTYDIPVYEYSIEYPKQKTKERGIRFFTKEQCRRVFTEMEMNPSTELLGIVIGLTTGMRIGEITGLRFEDIDWEKKTLRVERTIERVSIPPRGFPLSDCDIQVISASLDKHSAVIASSPKSASSRRICPIAALPYRFLKAYFKSPFGAPGKYIVGCNDKPIEPRTYRNAYYEILERLGLPKLNPHCMRHTFATHMLHNKVDVATIASILGHSSPAITLSVYSHTNEEEKAKQVNAVFGKLFKKY